MNWNKHRHSLSLGQAGASCLALWWLTAVGLGLVLFGGSFAQMQPGEAALQGDFTADAETRVVVQADGKRTTYERSRRDRSLVAVTYESLESDVVVQRKFYDLGPQGQELVCKVEDAKGNLLFVVIYSYDELGRRREEGTYNADGDLVRVIGFFWKDGRQLKPAVTRWRQDGVMWEHAADGSGVIPMKDQEGLTGKSNQELLEVTLTEEPIEAAFVQEDELRRGLLNKERPDGQMISLDEQIQNLDAEYMKESLSPEEVLIMERWRRKTENQAR